MRTMLLTPLFLIAACAGDQGPDEPPVATQLSFTVQPSDAIAGVAITPALQVVIRDASGNTVTSATSTITVALGNPGGGTLLGTKTVAAVAGIASFGDLVIEEAATGYTLIATSGTLSGATSTAFAITPAAKAALAVVVQPSAVARGEPITPAVQIAVQDVFGNTVETATDAVTVALATNPSGGTLSGTLTVAAIQGIATFSNLRIDQGAIGYALAASAAGLSGATSDPFAVALTFTAVSAGFQYTCGLAAAGTAYCWGQNYLGQLGDGTLTDRLTPTRVTGGLSFTSVSTFGQHACGVTAAGAVYCWGANAWGEIGDGTTTNRSTPVLVGGGVTFAAVSAGWDHTCGMTAAGAAYCWGRNQIGQLGDGTFTDRSTPTVVTGGLSFATELSAGLGATCGLTAAGTAYCWGNNSLGQLGDGTTTQRSIPTLVVGGVTFAAVSAGVNHTCGRTAAGTVYCWGDNSSGRLGDGTTTQRSTPTLVAGGVSYARISRTCGITAAGTAYCWGENDRGQLGDGTTTPRLTPTLVTGSLSFAAVSAAHYHTCGVTAAGAAWCWGDNQYGALGDGTMINRSSPVPVVQ